MADQLTEYTLIFGPPVMNRDQFDDFQRRIRENTSVEADHWRNQQEKDLHQFCTRDGNLKQHSLLETIIGAAMDDECLVLDHEVRWVTHTDGARLPAIGIFADDMRFRGANVALDSPMFSKALSTAMSVYAFFDAREWVRWVSISREDEATDQNQERTDEAVNAIYDAVFSETSQLENDQDGLSSTLITAISKGRACAKGSSDPMTATIQKCRRHSPLREEWNEIAADAIYLANIDLAEMIRAMGDQFTPLSMMCFYLGRSRTDALRKTGRFSDSTLGDMALKTFLTSFAFERSAPDASRVLCELMMAQKSVP